MREAIASGQTTRLRAAAAQEIEPGPIGAGSTSASSTSSRSADRLANAIAHRGPQSGADDYLVKPFD